MAWTLCANLYSTGRFYDELEKRDLSMFKDSDIILYRIQKSNVFDKLRGYKINENNTFNVGYEYRWYTGNIHEVYKLLTRTKCDLWDEIQSLRTAMKELEEYIFNLNAELLKSGIIQK